MSDTPRTDRVTRNYADSSVEWEEELVPVDACRTIERELNAANSRIQLLMSANADVARIAGERDAAEKRIRLLIAERDTARLQADKKHSLRGEFESLLGTDNIEEGIKAVKEMKERIKRLEDAGDKMASAYRQICYDAYDDQQIDNWLKAKEEKP